MKKKIERSMCYVALLAVAACFALTFGVLYGRQSEAMRRAVRTEAEYLSAAINANSADFLADLVTENRITLISPGGEVLFDNRGDSAAMENHMERPEVKSAIRTGGGEGDRLSSTLSERAFYRAVRLADGSVLRVSSATASVFAALWGYVPVLAAVALFSMVLAIVLAGRLTGRVVAPINEIDPEKPESAEAYDELAPLLLRLAWQNGRIAEQMGALERGREELLAITRNMSEALVMLSARGEILSINLSAERLFGVSQEDCAGRGVLALSRSLEMKRAADAALAGAAAKESLSLNGRALALYASPVLVGGEAAGCALLLLDVTEREQAERMRREFTANVSHELKTPLTSISGYAEIMKSGMAPREDMVEFAGRIYAEASRMIALVGDVIKLSRLDERAGQPPVEPVELAALAREVCGRFTGSDIAISVSGEEATVTGVRALLEEMLFNLVDNAVKYNVPGGSVRVRVERAGAGAGVRLTVSDTGVGIPPEDQPKVFERFYRVDKSHSRDTGGTGLGLSIVKHCALYHGAELALTSAPGRGTAITITFPKS